MSAQSTCTNNKPLIMSLISDLGPFGLRIFATGYFLLKLGLIRPSKIVINAQQKRFGYWLIIPLTRSRAAVGGFKSSLCSLNSIPSFVLMTDRVV